MGPNKLPVSLAVHVYKYTDILLQKEAMRKGEQNDKF